MCYMQPEGKREWRVEAAKLVRAGLKEVMKAREGGAYGPYNAACSF